MEEFNGFVVITMVYLLSVLGIAYLVEYLSRNNLLGYFYRKFNDKDTTALKLEIKYFLISNNYDVTPNLENNQLESICNLIKKLESTNELINKMKITKDKLKTIIVSEHNILYRYYISEGCRYNIEQDKDVFNKYYK